MNQQDEVTLENAVKAMRAAQPDAAQLAASAERVARRLGIGAAGDMAIDAAPIESCSDVRHLLPAYGAGTLAPARMLLIEAHLRECGPCMRQRHADNAAVVDWSTPGTATVLDWKPRKLGWGFAGAMAAGVALAACSFFAYQAYWQVPAGVRAQVESIDGTAYRIASNGDRMLAAGDTLTEGQQIRTSGGAHAVLRLSDGSTVEMKERSVLGVGARGRSMTLSLDDGAVIVQAAKRTSGHLYVKTPDCRVAVTGTVFSVNSGIKGSRVAVLEGTVHVEHLGADSVVAAGGQLETSDNLNPEPVNEQIAWSHDRDKYLPLLAQLATLRDRLQQVPSAPLRYSSDLLTRVPAETLLYISIPNFGSFLSQADKIFDDQLKQSPALQQWWGKEDGRTTAQLDAVIDKLHQVSEYLGGEIVVAGVKQDANPGFAVIADVVKPGLKGFLTQSFPASAGNLPLTIYDETSLASAKVADDAPMGGYALIREHEAVFSNSIAALRQVDAQLQKGESGFASSDFGQQIQAAYSRGAGVILAADLHRMMAARAQMLRVNHIKGRIDTVTGMDGVEYLIAEHREVNGQPQNHLNLQFSGTRQRVASWLGAPAPMGSLDFVSPNASVVVSLLSKDPREIADDLIQMTATDTEDGPQSNKNKDWKDAEAQMKISFRDDLAANLGGGFLLTLDGPVLPTPSWKAVVEIHDAQKLEQTLESLTGFIRNMAKQNMSEDKGQRKGFQGLQIESSDVGPQRYYAIRDLSSQNVVAQYTFADGYMIVAPSRAMLIDALRTHDTGNSLARSASFKALLPKDDHDNYSAIAYQNLSPVLGPLLSQFSGAQADAIRKLAADAKPTAICAWGRDNRIEAESDSSLLGFDFLTLGAMLRGGNNSGTASVKE
jgi:ferric-dicitrate binding protein FerR (iron transport regulator)